MPQLDAPLLRAVLEVMLPYMHTLQERETLIKLALGLSSKTLARLRLDGTAQQSVTQIIEELSFHELSTLIRNLPTNVDEDSRISMIISQLDEYISATQPIASSKMAVLPVDIELPKPTIEAISLDSIAMIFDETDSLWTHKLASDLQDEGYPVLIGFEGIRGDDTWKQSLVNRLYTSPVILVIVSPEALYSTWLQFEIRTAQALNRKIRCVLARQIGPNVHLEAYNPLNLENYRFFNFSNDYKSSLSTLLLDLPVPITRIKRYCQLLISRLEKSQWGVAHYIREHAKILPVNASPYDDGLVRREQVNLLERLHQSNRTIILGEPGSGKTVIIERLAWELAVSELPTISIIIKLLEYDGRPLLEWLRIKLNSVGEYRLETVEETAYFLQRLANTPHSYKATQRSNPYVLLDGLSEVRPAFRDVILNEIIRLASEFPSCAILVTSRVHDDGWRLLRHGNTIQDTLLIQPITPEEIQRYLRAYLGVTDAELLWNGLDERMKGLASNPLLLWFVKEAWLDAKDTKHSVGFPENRGELYDNFITRMLRRDDDRQLTPISRSAKIERSVILELLALKLQREQRLDISEAEAVSIIGDTALLDTLLRNGLLVGEETFRFAPHPTIQEYFAARALKKILEKDAYQSNIELNYASNPWWGETFIQLAGMVDDPNQLAQAVAVFNPWLAWWCVLEGRKVTENTRRIIEAKSIALVYSSSVADRRNAVQALAKLQTPRNIAPVIHLVQDEDEEVGNLAYEALIRDAEILLAYMPMLLKVLENIAVNPIRRAKIGRLIAQLGDPRRGVTTRDKLPDIDWCTVIESMYPYTSYKSNITNEEASWNFLISKYPITYAQYALFVEGDGYDNSTYWTKAGWLWKRDKKEPSMFWRDRKWNFPNHPIVGVSWYEAHAFSNWLDTQYRQQALFPNLLPRTVFSEVTAYVLRLPTEAEWTRAAFGFGQQKYIYGNEFDRYKFNVEKTGIGRTSAVGLFPNGVSPFGALDMGGNVWEWCLTKWREIYRPQEQNEAEGSEKRTLRGGSWGSSEDDTRAPSRVGGVPYGAYSNQGFRVVIAKRV